MGRCLIVALILCGAARSNSMIDPGSHPNYGPQLPKSPAGAVILGTQLIVALENLQTQFPQNDYYQGDGLVCYFNAINPAIHDICAPPVVLFPPEVDVDFVPASVPVPPVTLHPPVTGCIGINCGSPPSFDPPVIDCAGVDCNPDTPSEPAIPDPAIPEPATGLLTGLGVLGILTWTTRLRYRPGTQL